jgi:hypothetical protein
MKKKFLSMLTALLMITLMTSTVSAGGNVKLSSVTFKLSSLVAEGFASGLGNTDVTVVLNATGVPVVTCTNQGGTEAPGQNSPKISASGSDFLVHENYTKNGRSAFSEETDEPQPGLTAKQMGCPNNSWSANIDFVFWTNATIIVTDTVTGAVLLQQDYTCVTTRNPDSVSCTLVQ